MTDLSLTRRAVMAGAAAAVVAPALPALPAPAATAAPGAAVSGWWLMAPYMDMHRRAVGLAAAGDPYGWEIMHRIDRTLDRMAEHADEAHRDVLRRYRETGEFPARG